MRVFTKEWLKASIDDLMTIEEIILNENLTHISAFHTQQSIEKTMKALIEEYEINIPKIHKLIELNKILSSNIDGLDETILKKLDDLYIESRYPGDMGLLPYGKPTIDDAKKFYNFAKEVFHKVVNILNIKNDEYIINIYKNHKFLNEF